MKRSLLDHSERYGYFCEYTVKPLQGLSTERHNMTYLKNIILTGVCVQNRFRVDKTSIRETS